MKPYLISLLLLTVCVLFVVFTHEPATKLYHITMVEKDEDVHPVLQKVQDFLHRHGNDINILKCDDSISETDKLYDFVHNPSLEQNDIILLTSSDNSILVKPHTDIRKKFKLQQAPILFSGASNKTLEVPTEKGEKAEKLGVSSFPELESSMLIGRVWALRDCFLGYHKNIETDSNTFWKHAYENHPTLIKIDTDAHLFLYAEGTNKKDIHFDRFKSDIHYVKTDTHPYLISAENPDYLHTVVSQWRH